MNLSKLNKTMKTRSRS